jgi:site-specific DNA-methyltransferase (adenine-specific)
MTEKIGPYEIGMVHHTACLDALRILPDGCVDAVVTDPPYDTKTHEDAENGFRSRKSVSFAPMTVTDLNTVVAEMLRVSRRWVVCFCSLEMLGSYRDVSGPAWVRSGFWRRTDGCPQFACDRPGQPGEGIAIMHRPGPKRWNGGAKHGFWACGVERKDRQHETQKPIKLMVDLVRDFTDRDEIVLDCYSGYGTTAIACSKLDRQFLGFELDSKWVDAANRRIQKEREIVGEIRPSDAKRGQQIGLLTEVVGSIKHRSRVEK